MARTPPRGGLRPNSSVSIGDPQAPPIGAGHLRLSCSGAKPVGEDTEAKAGHRRHDTEGVRSQARVRGAPRLRLEAGGEETSAALEGAGVDVVVSAKRSNVSPEAEPIVRNKILKIRMPIKGTLQLQSLAHDIRYETAHRVGTDGAGLGAQGLQRIIEIINAIETGGASSVVQKVVVAYLSLESVAHVVAGPLRAVDVVGDIVRERINPDGRIPNVHMTVTGPAMLLACLGAKGVWVPSLVDGRTMGRLPVGRRVWKDASGSTAALPDA